MRIISGRHKGLRFNPPSNIPTRPTTDFAKEGLFNMLNNYFDFENVKFLDLFGGTGSISYEFASRGCVDITNIEKFPKCAAFIKKTAEDLKFEGFHSYCMDVFTYINSSKDSFDLIFAGPPYALQNLNAIPDMIIEKKLIDGKGWFIMEHNPNHNFDNHPNFYMKRNYGDTIFSIFVNDPSNNE